MLSSQGSQSQHSVTYIPDRSRPRPVRDYRNRREVTVRSITFVRDWSEHLSPTAELLNSQVDQGLKDETFPSPSAKQHLSPAAISHINSAVAVHTPPARVLAKSSEEGTEDPKDSVFENEEHQSGGHITKSLQDVQSQGQVSNEEPGTMRSTPKRKMEENLQQSLSRRSSHLGFENKNRKKTSSGTLNRKSESALPVVSKLTKQRMQSKRRHKLSPAGQFNETVQSYFSPSRVSLRSDSRASRPDSINNTTFSEVPGKKEDRTKQQDATEDGKTSSALERQLSLSQIGLPQVTSTPRHHGKMTRQPRLTLSNQRSEKGEARSLLTVATPVSGPAIRRSKAIQHDSLEETPRITSAFPQKKGYIESTDEKGVKVLVSEDGGTTRGNGVTDLDVLLQCIHTTSTAFRDNIQFNPCKNAVSAFAEAAITDITGTVNKINRLKKKIGMFNRNKLVLKRKRSQLSEMRKEYKRLTDAITSLDQTEPASKKTKSDFLSLIRSVQRSSEKCHVDHHRNEKSEEIIHYEGSQYTLVTSESAQLTIYTRNILNWLQRSDPLAT